MKKLIILVIAFFSFGVCEMPNRENCILKSITEHSMKSKDYTFVCSNDSLIFEIRKDRIEKVKIWEYIEKTQSFWFAELGNRIIYPPPGKYWYIDIEKDKYGIVIYENRTYYKDHKEMYDDMVIEWNRVKYAIDNKPTDTDEDYEPDGGWYCDKHDCHPF